MQRIDAVAAHGARDALVAAAGDLTVIGYVAAVVVLLLVVGVVLPAVWSSRPDRRREARAVLRLILLSLRSRSR
jgi:hypothetical protein